MMTYTKEDKAKIKGYLRELANEACWIGEDGMAACVSSTEKGAFIKFRRLMRMDVGDIEAEEIKIEDVGYSYLHLCSELSEEERQCMEEAEWYADATDKNPYQIFVLNV